jgi:CBS domain-containing protein
MRTVGQILRYKGHDSWSVAPGDTVRDALNLMVEKNIGAVLVVEGGSLVGILSERDCARKVILRSMACEETLVQEIMTSRVIYVRPEQTTDHCMALMTDKHVRHLPVLEGERLIGVISIGDVVKYIISEQEFIIEQLEHYVSGTGYLPPQRPGPW